MTTAEKIAVMQAYEDGKAIQVSPIGFAMWNDKNMPPLWNWAEYDYRIKPREHEYRPYKDTAEMIEDYAERFNVLKWPTYVKPLIWVKSEKITSLIAAFEEKSVWLFGFNYLSSSLNRLFKDYTYLDGSPIGKLGE